MARQTDASTDMSADLDQLKGDIDSLRKDLSSLTKHIKDAGTSAFDDVQALGAEKIDELRSELDRAASQVRKHGEASIADVERTVQERPLLSLLAAFGAGMLLTRLMERR